MRIIGLCGLAAALLLAAGCATVPEIPVLESGEPLLDAGSVLWKGVDGNLYVAAAGEERLTRLTDLAGPDPGVAYAAYAWAGDRVVFAAHELSRREEPEAALYSVLPGRKPRELVRRPGAAPFFLYPSPDGTRVAYLGSRPGSEGYALDSIGIRGTDPLAHGSGQPFYSAWSPDGRQLLTHIGLPGGTPGSYLQFQSVAGLERGEPMEPPLTFETGPFQAPAFSPDGASIAVVLRSGGTNVIALISVDGGTVRRLRDLDGVAAFAWSAGGDRLAFIDGGLSPTGGVVGNLWVTGRNDGTIQLVSERAAGFFWAPDGTKLLFLEPYVVSAEAESVFLYRVGIHHTFGGRTETLGSLRPTAEFVRQIMPFFDQYHRASTIWSPDSRLVVLNAVAENRVPVIHLVDTDLRRSGDAFSVAYRLPAQSGGAGFFPAAGVASRILGLGLIPFFSLQEPAHAGNVS